MDPLPIVPVRLATEDGIRQQKAHKVEKDSSPPSKTAQIDILDSFGVKKLAPFLSEIDPREPSALTSHRFISQNNPDLLASQALENKWKEGSATTEKVCAVAQQVLGRAASSLPDREGKEREEKAVKFKLSASNLNVSTQVLAGAAIVQTTLDNELVEGAEIDQMAMALNNFLLDQPSLSREDQALHDSLTQLNEFHSHLSKSSTLYSAFMRNKIEAMKMGETLTLSGGWNSDPGHAMIYRIFREDENKFTFEVFNTGAGIDNHRAKRTHNKLKFCPMLSVSSIPLAKMLTSEAWLTHHALMTTRYIDKDKIDFRNSDFIYNNFLNCFCPNFLEVAHKESRVLKPDYITPQKAGTCPHDVLFALMRFLSPSVTQYKSKKNQYKNWVLTQHVRPEVQQLFLETATASTSQDFVKILGKIKLLDYLLKRFAKSIHKGAKDPKLMSAEQAADGLENVRGLQKQLKRLKKQCRQIRLTGVDTKGKPLTLDIQPMRKEEEERKIARLNLNSSAFETRMDAAWPPTAVALGGAVDAWVKTLAPLADGDALMQREAHHHLREIFQQVPSLNHPIWKEYEEIAGKSSKESQKRAALFSENFLTQFSVLHGYFYKTMAAMPSPKSPSLVDVMIMQQNTNLLTRLCNYLLKPKIPFILEPENIYKEENASTHLFFSPEADCAPEYLDNAPHYDLSLFASFLDIEH